MNYREAIQQARDLDTLADKVRSTANDKVEQSMQVLSSGWKGNNATEFLRKYGQLKQQILDSAKELNAIADDIRRTAKIVYDAEMAALRIAQTRKAGRKTRFSQIQDPQGDIGYIRLRSTARAVKTLNIQRLKTAADGSFRRDSTIGM